MITQFKGGRLSVKLPNPLCPLDVDSVAQIEICTIYTKKISLHLIYSLLSYVVCCYGPCAQLAVCYLSVWLAGPIPLLVLCFIFYFFLLFRFLFVHSFLFFFILLCFPWSLFISSLLILMYSFFSSYLVSFILLHTFLVLFLPFQILILLFFVPLFLFSSIHLFYYSNFILSLFHTLKSIDLLFSQVIYIYYMLHM